MPKSERFVILARLAPSVRALSLPRASGHGLPASSVEGSVISQGRAGRGNSLLVLGQINWRQRRSDLLPQSLRRTQDAGGTARTAASSDHCLRQSLKRIGNPTPIAQLALDHQALSAQRPGGRIVALLVSQSPKFVQRGGDSPRFPSSRSIARLSSYSARARAKSLCS